MERSDETKEKISEILKRIGRNISLNQEDWTRKELDDFLDDLMYDVDEARSTWRSLPCDMDKGED